MNPANGIRKLLHLSASIFPDCDWSRCRLIMLNVYEQDFIGYFDDSKTLAGSVVKTFVVAGYVATVERWSLLSQEWEAILADPMYGLTQRYFHMVDFAQGVGQYAAWRDDVNKRAKFLESLISVAKKYLEYGFSIGVYLDEFQEVNSIYELKEHYSPYALCGRSVIQHAGKWANGNNYEVSLR